MNKNAKRSIGIVAGFFVLVLGFQNCQSSNPAEESASNNNILQSPSDPSVGSCTAPWGEVILNGQSATAYMTSSVGSGMQCEVAGQMETRTCSNGVLSGTFQYAFCSPDVAQASCALPWEPTSEIVSGESVVAYNMGAGSAEACEDVGNKQIRTCTNGVLSGAYSYGECVHDIEDAACTIDGTTVMHGDSVTAYIQQMVASGNCESTANSYLRECDNGMLSGDNKFQYLTCEETGALAKTCKLTLQNGKTAKKRLANASLCMKYYNASKDKAKVIKVHFGNALLWRKAGDLDSCRLDGKTVNSGGSHRFYSRQTAPTGHTCSEYDLVRTCANGEFIGSDTYKYADCSDSSSTPVNKKCEVVRVDGAKHTAMVASQAACKSYYDTIHKNNPTIRFDKVLFDGTVFYTEKVNKVCRVVKANGNAESAMVENKTDCLTYFRTLKGNQSNSNFLRVLLDNVVVWTP